MASGSKFTVLPFDIPKSVTAIPAEVLQGTGSITFIEVLHTVPGIVSGTGEGGNPVGGRPLIRGRDVQANTFFDGLRDIDVQSRGILSAEPMEITKGPSGAYKGYDATGGVVNIPIEVPKFERPTEGMLSVGNAAYKRVTADGSY